jgi:hypothetical protein
VHSNWLYLAQMHQVWLLHNSYMLSIIVARVATLQVPLPLLTDLAAGACVWDLALPDPRSAVPALASKIRFVAAALAKAAFGTCEDEQVGCVM